jgi:short-subunit dehydrogenase
MLSQELRGTGVTVTALTPDGVSTEFTAVAAMERQVERSLMARMSSPEDIARAGLKGLRSGARTVTPTVSSRAFRMAGRVIPSRIWLAVCQQLLA